MATLIDSDGNPKFTPVTLKATSSPGILTLSGRVVYSVEHNSLNDLGNNDVSSIFLHVSGNSGRPDNAYGVNYLAEDGKVILNSGQSIQLGPQINFIRYQSNSGTPTFSVIPRNPNHLPY